MAIVICRHIVHSIHCTTADVTVIFHWMHKPEEKEDIQIHNAPMMNATNERRMQKKRKKKCNGQPKSIQANTFSPFCPFFLSLYLSIFRCMCARAFVCVRVINIGHTGYERKLNNFQSVMDSVETSWRIVQTSKIRHNSSVMHHKKCEAVKHATVSGPDRRMVARIPKHHKWINRKRTRCVERVSVCVVNGVANNAISLYVPIV